MEVGLKMVKPRILILRTAGTNCDFETEWAFSLAGGLPERVHINAVRRRMKSLKDYQVLVLPGGFSYGDDIAAGRVLANEIRYNLGNEIQQFVSSKKPVIGICNGFQVLAKSGILPDSGRQQVTLSWNDSARFEARWVYLRVEKSRSPFFKGLPPVIRLPVAHAEGKLMVSEDNILQRIEEQGLTVLRYCDSEGNPAGYPFNPNGSVNNIAGLCDEGGMVLGIMPHPERCLFEYFYPGIPGKESRKSEGYGLKIFRNIVSAAG